jgi:predicted  nucleic acid-binding Zn-ribbon protein
VAAVALDKKALWREIEKDAKAKRRTVLAELRDRLRLARDKRTKGIADAKVICREAKLDARTRARRLEAEAKDLRAAGRGACDTAKGKATAARAAVLEARGARDAELEVQREDRKIAALAKGKKKPIASARERASESDDEVRANIPPELVRLFDRVRRSIKGTPRKSRTEAFLEYAEEHPSEVYEAIDDQTDALIAELQRREQEEYERTVKANPGVDGFVELGKVTCVEWRQDGRRRKETWSLSSAPILAYTPRAPRGGLVVIYPVAVRGRASAAALKEYAKTHWGKHGAGEQIDGDRALEPLRARGELLAITYTTEKGTDVEPVDYEHKFGDGAKGAWTPPTLLEHRCGSKKCSGENMVAIRGGTYRVTSHGIVG